MDSSRLAANPGLSVLVLPGAIFTLTILSPWIRDISNSRLGHVGKRISSKGSA